MSAREDRRSVTLHQQTGGMTIVEFAEANGITVSFALRAIKAGKVIGARQDARSKRWTIYPPAKLTVKPGKPRGRAVAPVDGRPVASAALPDPLAGVDAVGVEAGTESRRSGQASPPVDAEGLRPPADGVCGCAAALPAPFASPDTAAACRCLSEAAARVPARFVLELSEPLLLWAWGAAHRDLGKLLDDVKKGRCPESDTRHARALYAELSKLVYSRMPKRKRADGGGLEAAFWLTDAEREELKPEDAL